MSISPLLADPNMRDDQLLQVLNLSMSEESERLAKQKKAVKVNAATASEESANNTLQKTMQELVTQMKVMQKEMEASRNEKAQLIGHDSLLDKDPSGRLGNQIPMTRVKAIKNKGTVVIHKVKNQAGDKINLKGQTQAGREVHATSVLKIIQMDAIIAGNAAQLDINPFNVKRSR